MAKTPEQDRDRLIARLRAHREELARMGVRRLALFGSQARGDAGPDSDVDLAVVFDDAARDGGLAYFRRRQRVADRLSEILGVDAVDLSDEAMQRPELREAYAAERVYAF